MQTKQSPKHEADSIMNLLGKAMDRNTELITSTPKPWPTPKPVQPATAPRAQPIVPTTPRCTPNTGMRLNARDHEKINRIIAQGMTHGERLTMSNAIRLALFAYDETKLSPAEIRDLRVHDGRSRSTRQ